MLRDSIGEQQKRQQEMSKALTEWDKMECAANAKQTQGVVAREEKTVLEQRSDRQKADKLSKFNGRHRRKCEFLLFLLLLGSSKTLFRDVSNENPIARHSFVSDYHLFLVVFALFRHR